MNRLLLILLLAGCGHWTSSQERAADAKKWHHVEENLEYADQPDGSRLYRCLEHDFVKGGYYTYQLVKK